MRIGVLTSVHPPMDTRIYFKQARALARDGHEVYLVARAGGDIRDLHYIPLPVPRSRWTRVLTCLRILRIAIRLRCDAYHIHDPELLPIGVLVRLVTKAYLIYDVHENVRSQIRNKYWVPAMLRGPVARLYSGIEWLCLRWVHHVVLAEDSYLPDYRGRDATVVRNYPILPAAVRSAKPRTYSGRPMLAYCGVVARIRGGLEMIETVELLRHELPDVQLQLIGPFFPPEFEQEVRARIQERSLENHVQIHGRLPMDAALAQVEKCDIGLALLHPDPNYVESLPTKMFEYMALRLPVVVSNFPLWQGIVESSGCGVTVDPLSTREAAEAVKHLGSDPERLQVLGNNGRRAVLERYSWEAEDLKLLTIYRLWQHGEVEAGAPIAAATSPAPMSAPATRARIPS